MRIDIIGAGALGLLYAGKLAAAGAEIRMWVRKPETADMLRREGIAVAEQGGEILNIKYPDFEVHLMESWPLALPGETGDWVLLMTKQDGIREAAECMAKGLVKNLHIVCMQNGIGHIEAVGQLLPDAWVYPAVTTEGARRQSGESVVMHAGKGVTELGSAYHYGSAQPFAPDGREKRLADKLTEAGLETRISRDIDRSIYRKLLVNAVINPLTAIWRIPNGELLSSRERMDMLRQVYDESIRIFDACGIAWEAEWWEELLQICRSTAANRSSMLADVLAGRRTEIEAINGQFIRLAEGAGMEAPLHRMIRNIITGMQ
ncbi:ketopantoate reductase family protein [Paenibacillus sp. P96]|uniref:2-dehydropantoate 2-reductase n=1 Tax=Paenibacillus zeirhizosphaerae TaxID=2987519 RepID=A0ABT9FQE4_9BACL|nr:ketopantoate reductase family protein [Paenibacillus sp. P96]MDP4096952.1 ketopantoate reductase family protein [Paenibacillus sp. P96]